MLSSKKEKQTISFSRLPSQSQQKFKVWTNLDIQIHNKQLELKKLKEQQEKIEAILIKEISSLSILDSNIVLDKYKFQVKKEKSYSTLSFKYLEQELPKIIKNPYQVKQICQFLKQQRQVKINNVIDKSIIKPRKRTKSSSKQINSN
tara:strand:+ start:6699 stop:7139 length:441 start_codon:yes stop_codon:yes gene_type:complete